MLSISIEIHGIDLKSGLKEKIAKICSTEQPSKVPLSLGFQRQGLVFRSAILRQLTAQKTLHITDLISTTKEVIKTQSLDLDPIRNYWHYQTIVTSTGWLECTLTPLCLAEWLDQCSEQMDELWDKAIASSPPPQHLFSYQFLESRCQHLLQLAENTAPKYQPQWYMTDEDLPDWEQGLLEAIAKLLLALIEGTFKENLLINLDRAFGEFHRHSAIFSFYPRQPQKFAHYCRWLWLTQTILHPYLVKFEQSTYLKGDRDQHNFFT